MFNSKLKELTKELTELTLLFLNISEKRKNERELSTDGMTIQEIRDSIDRVEAYTELQISTMREVFHVRNAIRIASIRESELVSAVIEELLVHNYFIILREEL